MASPPNFAVNRSSPRSLGERVDWNLLRTFQVVAQELSISRAAARLHLSQPAVSQGLKRLEEQMGTRLIERHGPKFLLTQSGIETLRVAGEVLGQFAQLDAALEQSDGQVVGKVRLLAVSGIQCDHYDRFLAALHRDFPGITLEIEVQSSDAIVSALSQKTASFGLAVNRTPQVWLGQELLTRERYGFYCGHLHPLYQRDALKVGDLRTESVISFTGDLLGGTLSALAEFRDRHHLSGQIVASSANTQEVLRLVMAGFGIGCLPEHVCEGAVAAGRLWRLPPAEGVCEVDIDLLWHLDQRLTMAETVFLQRLRSAQKECPPNA